MKKEKDTISNQHYEILHVAKKMGVPVWFVHLAKDQTKSNDRQTVESWIDANWQKYEQKHREI